MSNSERGQAFAKALEYVQAQRQAGRSDEQIRAALETAGWAQEAIEELLSTLPPGAPPPQDRTPAAEPPLKRAAPWRAWPIEDIPRQAQRLLDEAAELIEAAVDLSHFPDLTRVEGVGGPLMAVVRKVEQADALQPGNPDVAFIRAMALWLNLQGRSGTEALEDLVRCHPDYWLAQAALRYGSPAACHLTWPAWPEDGCLPPAVSRVVHTVFPIGFRDGLMPLVVFLARSPSSEGISARDFANVRWDVAFVDTGERDPLLSACVFRIWDNPTNPFIMEALGVPLESGQTALCWEILCRRKLFAVASVEEDNLTAIRQVRLGPKGSKAADQILDAMVKGKVESCSQMDLMMAARRYQKRMPIEALPFEPVE